MPYTLMKGLVWILLAVLLGVVVGWLLRSVAAKRQIERARNGNVGTVDDAELERLRHRVANLEPLVGERDRLKHEIDDLRSTAGAVVGSTAAAPGPASVGEVARHVGPGDEATDAAAVLGRPVTADDLTVIEGIGPTIAELCQGIGITTWAELSVTEVSLLRTMLNDAGQRFKASDPSTWPTQAGLLAAGSWAEFVSLGEELDGGRTVD